MEEESQNRYNRREFYTRILRYSALGLLTVMGGSILAKRRKFIREGKCVNFYYCANCDFLSECELPEATAARQNLSDKT